MAANFPISLDDFINYVDGTTIMESITLNDMQFAIEALEAKVGVNNSIVVASHDFKLANILLPSGLAGGNDSIGETTIGEFEIKWGKKTISGTSGTLTFTSEGLAAFTNNCFQAFPVPGRSSVATAANLSSHSPTKLKFDWKSNDASDVSPMRWFAIGR